MRKTPTVLFLVIAALSFVACGGNDSGSSGGNAAPESEGDFDAFCAASQDFARALGTSGTPDFEAMQTALADMEANAPEEIREAVTTVKDAFDAGLEGQGNPMQEDEVQAANDEIFDYLGESDCEPPEDA